MRWICLSPGTVHPHGCGEHRSEAIAERGGDGSSPRVWGTRQRLNAHGGNARFIPTGVGNTLPARRGLMCPSVHPHGCGEHDNHAIDALRYAGSSPRVWGTLHAKMGGHQKRRFIPTGVGNTCKAKTPPLAPAVHPHGCGEHTTLFKGALANAGSSPRVWGTLAPLPPPALCWRFIPTGVGNTIRNLRRGNPFAVHPHGCGEHGMPARGA